MTDTKEARDMVAIRLIERLLDRMKRINGKDSKCVYGENWGVCENHSLIHEAENFLSHSSETQGEK